jgi:hypothetical protein
MKFSPTMKTGFVYGLLFIVPSGRKPNTNQTQTSNSKPQTSNFKPQTSNLKLQTSNLKLQTSNQP